MYGGLWPLNTLDASNAIEVLERAIKGYGAPEIINFDQGIGAQNPGACLCDGCIGKKVMAKPKIITTFVSTSKTQSTTYSEGSAPRKH